MHSFPVEYGLDKDIYFPCRHDGDDAGFGYSDGEEFERRIEAIIAAATDRSLFSTELRDAIWDWRSACHLSAVRANILRPVESACCGRVLELGSGCGVITRYLAELGADVVALEASARRAAITRLRTCDLRNVSVVCDRIEEFEAEEKFDVVTLIGVLQYARIFSKCGGSAEIELLQRATDQMRRDGVLVIAIQNKIGLKYFSGFPEPNVDVPYFGIESRYKSDTVVRFGLKEFRDMLRAVGLEAQAVMFPLPDYHMPVSVLTEAGAIPNGHFSGYELIALSVGRDRARPDWMAPAFSLERAWEAVYQNGLAPDLANSFLLVAGRTEESLRFLSGAMDLGWHYSIERHPAFATVKHFKRSDGQVVVVRKRLEPRMAPLAPVIHHVKDEPYVVGRLWWVRLLEIVNESGWDSSQIGSWARPWLDALCDLSGLRFPAALSLDERLPGGMFDMTPMNCIETSDGRLQFFDAEWEIKASLALSYVVIRGVFGSLATIASCAEPRPGTPLGFLDLLREALRLQGIGITEHHIESYIAQESSIQHWIMSGRDGAIGRPWADYVKGGRLVVRAAAGDRERTLEAVQGQLGEARAQVVSLQAQLSGRRWCLPRRLAMLVKRF